MRTLVLHNPGAGSGNIAAEELLAALASGGIAARYCSTKDADFPDAFRDPVDLVVVAGGDGTVVKPSTTFAMGTCRSQSCRLAARTTLPIPWGSKPDPIEIARAGCRQTEARRLDIGTAAGPWGKRLFVEAVGIGVLAEAAAATDEKGVEGLQGSRLARKALCEMLAKAEPEGVTFTIDGQAVEIRFLLAEIMNTASTGPRLSLAPAAEPGEGLLDRRLAPRCWTGLRRPRRTRRRSRCDPD